MTPAQHLAAAERALDGIRDDGSAWGTQTALILGIKAAAHALCALAIETGAPHAQQPAGGQ
jgi:hypothetical protein